MSFQSKLMSEVVVNHVEHPTNVPNLRQEISEELRF